jgi:hypothetical protein
MGKFWSIKFLSQPLMFKLKTMVSLKRCATSYSDLTLILMNLICAPQRALVMHSEVSVMMNYHLGLNHFSGLIDANKLGLTYLKICTKPARRAGGGSIRDTVFQGC